MPKVIFIALVFWVGLNCGSVFAQDHGGHRAEDMDIHNRFYKNWMMPDNRGVSCCHDEDCFPAQSKFEGGAWYGRKTDDDEWTKIPASKIEQDRDSPDGRSHMCGRRYGFNKGEFTVFCFLPAGGS